MSAANRPTRKLGDFELTVISDGTYYLDAGGMFGVVPKPLWEKKVKADELNRIACGTNAVLVRALGRLVLIETGHRLPSWWGWLAMGMALLGGPIEYTLRRRRQHHAASPDGPSA